MYEDSIKRAVKFLSEVQLPWGEFPIYVFHDDSKQSRAYAACVFGTAFVLHGLASVRHSAETSPMKQRAIRFLLDERESNGLWRYFAKRSNLSPDLDTTVSAAVALIQNGINPGRDLLVSLLGSRHSESGLFHTWAEEPPTAENDIDSVVNANVAYLFGLMDSPTMIPEVASYLNRESTMIRLQNSQVWYYSPYVFCYAVSRALCLGHVTSLEPSRSYIREFILSTRDELKKWGAPLETALAISSLVYVGESRENLMDARSFLLDSQLQDCGGWAPDFFYVPRSGSESITTAMCLEALVNSGVD